MKKHLSKILITILFLAGLSLLLYPFVSNEWNNYRQKRLISDYDQTVADMEAAGEIDYEAEWERATEFNHALLPSILPDAFANAEGEENKKNSEYMACLNITGDGMMGTVEVPKIHITLPIYHGTEEETLEKAAGHLPGSSLPVGGEDTHAVITAHRGLPSAALFTDLDKLEEGDHFLLHILKETLCYEVDQISVVEPENTDALAVEKGMDLATLLTCTPYGVNSHRMLVRGHRVPYVPEELADEGIPLSNMSLHTNYLLWVVLGLLLTGIFSFFLYRREKKLSATGQTAESQSTDVQAAAGQTAESRSTDVQAAAGQTTESQGTDVQVAESQSTDMQAGQTAENRSTDVQTAAEQTAEPSAPENHPLDSPGTERRESENRETASPGLDTPMPKSPGLDTPMPKSPQSASPTDTGPDKPQGV